MVLDLMLLLSLGRHPQSYRTRVASADARAVELALQLGDAVRLHAVHAGDPDEAVLADYLGMGLSEITVLRNAPGADIWPALQHYLRTRPPALVLTGMATESGEGSGMLPYLVAHDLNASLLPAAATLTLSLTAAETGRVQVEQALARGQRRLLRAELPCVITVASQAPPPRQSAYARARAGRINVFQRLHGSATAAPAPDVTPHGREIPARKNPKRMQIAAGGSVAERLSALTSTPTGSGRVLAQASPDEAAQAILDYLKQQQLLRV